MGRRIITIELQAASSETKIDTYFDKVIKYIPADIIGAWIAVKSLINTSTKIPTSTILWISIMIGVILTNIWTLRQTKEPKKRPAITQTVISTVAFIDWVFALGGPFATLGFYRSVYGSL